MSQLKPYNNYYPVQYDYIAQLPEDWQLLPNLAIFQERKETGGEELDSLSVSAKKGIVRMTDYKDKKDRTSDDKSGYLIVHKGDIPYNTMLMWSGAVGRSEYHGIVSPAYTVLKPRYKVIINTKFFHYMFRTQFYKDYAKRFSYGIVDSRLRLYHTYFKRMYSIVPPLETQDAIVNYLDRKTQQIQSFIQKKERLIELLEEEKQNFIDKIYLEGLRSDGEYVNTGKDWITKIPKGWKLLQIKYLTKVISKGTTPSTEGHKMADKGVRYIKAENIQASKIIDYPKFFIDERTNKVLKRSQLEENDILFVIAGATIGKVAIVKSSKLPANTNQAVSFIRLKNSINVEYCFYWLQSSFVYTTTWLTAVQAAQPNLAMEDLGNVLIPLPKLDEEKIQITSQIKREHKKIDKAINKAFQEIEKAKEYQESLITQVVTGQLKVPHSATTKETIKNDL